MHNSGAVVRFLKRCKLQNREWGRHELSRPAGSFPDTVSLLSLSQLKVTLVFTKGNAA